MFTCKFCGLALVRAKEGFVAPEREFALRSSVTGENCWKGACLNRAGQITLHHPDAPEYNGGTDYSDGRSLYSWVDA